MASANTEKKKEKEGKPVPDTERWKKEGEKKSGAVPGFVQREAL